jgi:hypothetical protein
VYIQTLIGVTQFARTPSSSHRVQRTPHRLRTLYLTGFIMITTHERS